MCVQSNHNISSLGENKYYEKIINFLSLQKFATRADIGKHLHIQSGGGLTELLEELMECGFIEKYTPYNLASESNVARYCIADAYLQFYFKFLAPIAAKIEHGDFSKQPESALNLQVYHQWLSYAFERFCRKYHRVIASILGFSAVKYRSGVYFKRPSDGDKGYQIDLLFDRDDKVMTVCEIKYLKSQVPPSVIDECEERFQCLPDLGKKTLHRVLISNHGPSEGLIKRAYFDRFISIEDLFKDANW